MSETTFYLIGIAVLCALIFFSAATTLGEFTFLVSITLIGGGYVAVLAQAFFGISALWAAVVLTALGMIVGFLRIEGRPMGVICNDNRYLSGAIDCDGSI